MPQTIAEFGEAVSWENRDQLAGEGEEDPPSKRYASTVEGHDGAIKSLFERIDESSLGFVKMGDSGALGKLVCQYTGEEFDEDAFFEAWDEEKHFTMDAAEFGLWVASCAEGDRERMAGTISRLHAAMDRVEATRWALDG